MSDMKAYLAAKYMSGPKADAILAHSSSETAKKLKKKRKKEGGSSTAGASASFAPGGIRDEDAGWGGADVMDEDPDDVVVASDRSFKKRKVEGGNGGAAAGGGWATLDAGIKEGSPAPGVDESPLVVQEEEQKPFVGGLVTADQLAARLGKGDGGEKGKGREQAQEGETEEERRERELAQETVYRDASGRKIDMKAERAEAARKKREREEREAAKMEWGKGLVQKGEEEKRRAALEREKGRDMARYADDKEMNEEMKGVERWNDPAAAFLTVRVFSFLLRSLP